MRTECGVWTEIAFWDRLEEWRRKGMLFVRKSMLCGTVGNFTPADSTQSPKSHIHIALILTLFSSVAPST